MNKKLLFAAMTLAAFTACTDSDFESQQNAAEEVGSVQFKVINNNDAFTRASMDETGNNIVWNANDGDLFTLYHGAAENAVTGFENACYEAKYGEDGATLSTPTMIKQGRAIMVWPADTTFRVTSAKNLTLTIPTVLEAKDENGKGGVENAIPYVSDLINIAAYDPDGTGAKIGYKNTAGKDREYPVYMRPMASQLNLKANYVGEAMGKIKDLADATKTEDPIDPITLTSVTIGTTGDASKFTKTIPIKFTDPADLAIDKATQWTKAENAWEKVTDFNLAAAAAADLEQVNELTTKVIQGTESCKFLFLPQGVIGVDGVAGASILLETKYGKVEISADTYNADQWKDAWYRFVSDKSDLAAINYDADAEQDIPEDKETTGEGAGKYKITAENLAKGLKQTINFFSGYKAKSGYVNKEPRGTATTRYVNVILDYLDMQDLHIKDEKQLRDVVRVWKALGLPSVTVYLDGKGENWGFSMSKQTIDIINNTNAEAGAGKFFSVKPCHKDGEKCDEIVLTSGGEIPNLTFIKINDDVVNNEPVNKTAEVILQTGKTWNWNGPIKVQNVGVTGISCIKNRGTMENAASKTLLIVNTLAENPDIVDIPVIIDRPGKWDIKGGIINVQNRVTNNGTVTIFKNAQYRQDGGNVLGNGAKLNAGSIFINDASTLENDFLPGKTGQMIGKVVNNGVFAAVGSAIINNYSLIEHADDEAKTYITHNQKGGVFANPFGDDNKMGRINLEYTNKDEDNISISAVDNPANMEGFVSVTVTEGNYTPTILNNTAVGEFVNYIIIKSGINEITNLSAQIKYVQINEPGTEVEWNLVPVAPATDKLAQYKGLIVLSDVNIKLGTTITSDVTYLDPAAEMYVGGVFNKDELKTTNVPADPLNYAETDKTTYYGGVATTWNTNYVTFK